MPRFVILRHETPPGYSRPDHYDLMLEHGDVLWTWACERLPEAGETMAAERLPDHRPLYLDYEGEVPRGRGCVRRVDAGEYELLSRRPDSLAVELRGASFCGTLTLTPLAAASPHWHIARSL